MMIRKLLRCSAALMFAGMALQSIARADDSAPAAEKVKVEPAAEKVKAEPADAIRQALTKKIEWSFAETPLGDFAEFLLEDLKIPIRLDTKALNDLGVTPETPVTFQMSGITAKTALKLLLKDLGLTIIIDDEVLIITSPDVADFYLTTVIYDVSDLPACRRANGKTMPDFDALSDVITRTIKPTTWDEVGGACSIQPFEAGDVQALVISQTWEAHEEILKLLTGLRKLRQWPLGEKEIEKLPLDLEPKPQFQGMGGMGMGGMGGGMMGGGGKGAGVQHAGTPNEGTPSGDKPGTGEAGGKSKGG